MRESLKNAYRTTLMRAGARSSRLTRWSHTAHRYTTVGRWAAQWGSLPTDFGTRIAMQEAVVAEISTAVTPLYLEFGVYEGTSLRWWADHLHQPGARLVGFDSFEGLPEAWGTAGLPAGAFAVDAVPSFDDERVSLQVGWFDDTLRHFTVPDHDRLVLSVDSDLYSSAVTVLEAIGPHLRAGDFVYFDELSDVEHELRALTEYTRDHDLELVPWGFSVGGVQWMCRVR